VDPNSIADRAQRDVYILVVKHYLACCSRDAVGKETVLTVKMATEEFTAKGLMVVERNWLEIYAPWERWSTGQGEIPTVQVGSRFIPTSLWMKDGRTTAPNPISGTFSWKDPCSVFLYTFSKLTDSVFFDVSLPQRWN
jgi:DNA topoisomerase-3